VAAGLLEGVLAHAGLQLCLDGGVGDELSPGPAPAPVRVAVVPSVARVHAREYANPG